MARDDDEGVPLPTEAEQQPMADRPPIRHTPRRQGGREEEGRKVIRSRKMFASNPELHRRVTAFFGVCVLPFALLIAGAGVVFITVVPGKNPLMGMAFGIFSLLAGSLSFLVALRMIVGKRSADDHFFSPRMLRICAGFFFSLAGIALAGVLVIGNWDKISSGMQFFCHLLMGFALMRLARLRDASRAPCRG